MDVVNMVIALGELIRIKKGDEQNRENSYFLYYNKINYDKISG